MATTMSSRSPKVARSSARAGVRTGGRSARVAKPNGNSYEQIAVAAYYRAERRGFAPGQELNDWLEAEREVHASPAKAR